MTIIVFRPAGDERTFEVNNIILTQMTLVKDHVWLFPEDSDVSVLKLVNAMNMVFHGHTNKHKRLHGLLQAMDFSCLETNLSLSLSPKYQSEINFLELLRNQLSTSQQSVWDRLIVSTSFVEFIAGPFGTGKTTFLVLLILALVSLGHKVLVTCSSNAATDHLAQKYNLKTTSVKGKAKASSKVALCFHPIFAETNAVKAEAATHQRKLARETIMLNKATDVADHKDEDTRSALVEDTAAEVDTTGATNPDNKEGTNDDNDATLTENELYMRN